MLLAAIPAVAAAASPAAIAIIGVSSPQAESGLLSIQAAAPSAITSLSAYIYAGTTLELTLPSADFVQTSGADATAGTWTLTSPITQSQLGLGTYTVLVFASDSGGDSVADVAGTFFFGLLPSVTLFASNTTLSYFQQTVELSGTVTAYYPDGSDQAMPGQTVTVSGPAGHWTTTTDASGGYFLSVQPDVASGLGNLTAAVAGSPTMQAAVSPAVTLVAQPDPVQVTVALSTSKADFGQPVTLSGTALVQSAGLWIPFADSAVNVSGSRISGQSAPVIRATTDDSGAFSVTLPAGPTTTWYADPAPDGYLAPSYPAAASDLPNSAPLTVVLPTALTGVTVNYTPAGQLAVAGCLGLAPAASSFGVAGPAASDLELQYSRTGSGWTNLSDLTAARAGPCGGANAAGAAFSDTVKPPALTGYYRVTYAGQPQFEPSVTASHHAATVPTRFSGFSISRASGHGRVTASGKLEQKAPGWKGLGGAPVTLYIELKGSGLFLFKKLHVSASGTFRFTFADSARAHWVIGYAGDTAHLASKSRIVYFAGAGSAASTGRLAERLAR